MRKAQMKMFETIAVLIIFFFLLIMGLVFYANVERKSISQKQEEFDELKEVELAQLISAMPELECPTTLETENCVDLYKLKALTNDRKPSFFKNNINYYFDIFGFSTITVDIIGSESYVLYDNKQGESSSRINVPVSVYNPITKTKEFGILNITSY